MPICSVPIEELDPKKHRLNPRQLLVAEEVQGLTNASPVERLTALLRSAKTFRGEQDIMYARERARRFASAGQAMEDTAGRARLREGLRELKGELPKITFESPESMFTPSEIDGLFNQAHVHWGSNPDAVSLSIRSQQALEKLFLGAVPQPNEIDLLGDVFGQRLVVELQRKMARPSVWDEMVALAGVSRAVLSTFIPDFSAIGRQGALAVGTPKEYLGAIPTYLKATGSQGFQDALRDVTRADPLYHLAEESKLAMPAFKRIGLTAGEHEEFLMASERTFVGRLVSHFPPIRMAQRGYETFLSKYRFDAWRSNLRGAGVDVDQILAGRMPTPEELTKSKQLANIVNGLSGRGSLGPVEGWAPALNSSLFSARNLAAKVQVPVSVFHPSNPRVRKLALQGLVGYASLYIGTLAAVKASGLADVELDPRSTDFGKMRAGPLRIDPSGGYAPIIRLVARVSQGETKLSTGEIAKMNRGEAVLRFVRSKASPPAGLMWDVVTGETAIGEEVTAQKQAVDRLVPITIQDIRDAVREGGWVHGVIAGPLSVLGVGTTSYPSPPEDFIRLYREKYGRDPDPNISPRQLDPELAAEAGYSERSEFDVERSDILAEDEQYLSRLAPDVLRGNQRTSVQFDKAIRDYFKKRGGVTEALARDFSERGQSAATEYWALDPTDEQFLDEDGVPDYDAWEAARRAAIAGLPPNEQEAIQHPSLAVSDPQLQRAVDLWQAASTARDGLYDVPKYRGVSVNQAREVAEFNADVKDWRLAQADRTGQTPTIEVGIRWVGRAQRRLPVFIRLVNNMRSSTWKEENRDPRFLDYLGDHRDELEPFYPDLYALQWVREGLQRRSRPAPGRAIPRMR